MMIPGWILDSFAAVMLAVAALSAGRLAAAWRAGRLQRDSDVDAAHLLMGISMAGMLVGGLHTLPNGAWAAIFAVITIWFGWQVLAHARGQGLSVLGTGHHLPHMVHGAAMVYMLVAVTTGAHTAGAGMSGMGTGASSMGMLEVPTLGLVFALLMAAWAVWDLDHIGSAHHRVHRSPGFSLAGGQQPSLALATAGAAGVLLGEPDESASPAAAVAAAGPAGAVIPPSASGAAAAAQVSPVTEGPAARILAPSVAMTCRIAMGVTMAFMLVIML